MPWRWAFTALLLSALPAAAQPFERLSPAVETAVVQAFAAMQADGLEHAICLDAEEQIIGTVVGEADEIAVACDPATVVTLIHTHPAGAAPSDTDMTNFLSQDYPILDRSIIVGADGSVTVLRGLNAGRPRSDDAVALIASRYALLTEIYRVASDDGPLTEAWPFSQLCIGLQFGCLIGPSLDALAPVTYSPLTGAVASTPPAFEAWLRDRLANWIVGVEHPGLGWAGLGDLALTAPIAQRYRHAVFFIDNANVMNANSALPSQVNLLRVVDNGFAESFEILAGGRAAGEPDTCIRTGVGVDGVRHGGLGDTTFVRLTAGDFDLTCVSQDDLSVTAVVFQRLRNGRLTFYSSAEDRAADRPIADVAADTGCGYDMQAVQRICDGVLAENFVPLGELP